MTTIIIEDEAIAARRLKKLIEKQGLEVIAELHSVKEAVNWFQKNKAPEIMFLDIQLSDGISFEIFEKVQPNSAIIFTTAYDEYALKAFKFNSIDYLLKPIQEKELIKAIEKFKASRPQSFSFTSLQIQQLLQTNFESKFRERFLVEVGQRLKTIETQNIALFYSQNKATYLLNKSRSYLINNSLDDLETQIDDSNFFRISRKAIVNLNFIDDIFSHSGNRLILKVNGIDNQWIVSRERVSDFKNWLAK